MIKADSNSVISEGSGAWTSAIRFNNTSSNNGNIEDVESEKKSLSERIRALFLLVGIPLVKDASLRRPSWIVLQIVGLLHLILLALPVMTNVPWTSPLASSMIVPTFQKVLFRITLISISPSLATAGQTPQSLWVLSVCFSLILYILIALAITGGKQANWRISTLRFLILCGVIAFPVTLVTSLLSPLICTIDSTLNPAKWSDMVCWNIEHIAIVFLSVVILTLNVLLLLIASATLFPRGTDLKTFPIAVAHGRVELFALIIKFTFAVVAIASSGDSSWTVLGFNFVLSLALFFAYLNFLPYRDQLLNRFMCAISAVIVGSTASTLLAQGLSVSSEPASATERAGLVWVCIVPLLFHVGWSMAEARWRSISKLKDLPSSYIAELRIRSLIADGVARSKAGPHRHHENNSEISKNESGGGVSHVEQRGASCPVWKPSSQGVNDHSSVARAVKVLLSEASSVFPTSALMALFSAQSIREESGNRFLELKYLSNAAAAADDIANLDVYFYTSLRLAQLQDEERQLNKGKMTVHSRINFDTQTELAQKKLDACRTLILSFWNVLCEAHPDLEALQAKASLLDACATEADTLFRDLLILAPTSIPLLRTYSSFLFDVMNNPARATELMDEADQLEDDQTRFVYLGSELANRFVFGSFVDLDLTRQTVALLTISANVDDGTVGTIVKGNSAALKLFGYDDTKNRDMIGKNLQTIIPQPFAQMHARVVQAFLRDGIQHMTGAPRSLFGHHNQGHIFPMVATVQAVGNEFFVAAEEVAAPDVSFVFFLGAETGWQVTAASKPALNVFGFTAEEIDFGKIFLTESISDPSALLEALEAFSDDVVVAIESRDLEATTDYQHNSSNSNLFSNTPENNKKRTLYGNANIQEIEVPHLTTILYILRVRLVNRHAVNAARERGTLIAPIAVSVVEPSQSARETNFPLQTHFSSPEFPQLNTVSSAHSLKGSSADDLLFTVRQEPLPLSRSPVIYEDNTDAIDNVTGLEEHSPRHEHYEIPNPQTQQPQSQEIVPKMNTKDSSSTGKASGSESGMSASTSSLGSGLKKLNSSKKPPSVPSTVDGSKSKSTPSKTPKKDKASVSLSGSGLSGNSSIISPAEMIRRGVALKGSMQEKSLKNLSSALIFVFVAIAITNLLQYTVSRILLGRLLTNFQSLFSNSARSSKVLTGFAQVQEQVLVNENKLIRDSSYFDWSNERIRTSVNEVELIHHELYLQALKSTEDIEKQHYLSFRYTVDELIPGSYMDRDTFSTLPRNTSLANIVLEYVARQREFWWYPLSQVKQSDEDTFWLERNAPFALIMALNNSLFESGSQTEGLADDVIFSNYIVLGAALCLILYVSIFVIVPGVRLFLNEQMEIYEVFSEIPIRSLRSVRDSLVEKLSSKQNTNQDDEAIMVATKDDAPHEVDRGRKRFGGSSGPSGGAVSHSPDPEDSKRYLSGSASGVHHLSSPNIKKNPVRDLLNAFFPFLYSIFSRI
jgi:PAS domain S-box-containing protein